MTSTPPAADTAPTPDRIEIDTSRPHPARVYDWFLGGKDNYPVDEALGRQIVSLEPQTKYCARHNRWFMQRATRHLARTGTRQFLDIGAGIPTVPNLHTVAQRVNPEARVVYVDNDPIVLAHAEALLNSTPEGATAYLQADAREPDRIARLARDVLDFTEPVAVSLIALLHFVPDADGAYDVVGRLVDALPSGSHLVLTQLAGDVDVERTRQAVAMYRAGGVTLVPRTREETERFFTSNGLDLVDPGVVWLPDWRPHLGVGEERDGTAVPLYAGVGRKP
ncbi:SAM-dependent methyltransferase [Streptomyces sp. NBC_00237]|uniref:SAM-dependent methyltransferase n=1 Tax=Streptomyces sp. NBC_00237 TaxID=2975687 RepID=UPI0022557E54|nr:SAM-dependent methyltransferase [Streptomyces sp. NBC_00237]MCX5202792.1 SAM-dependent methyltransferase [Streptomyces sp. NBC_00237]